MCVCVCFWVSKCVCIGLCLYIACLVACREFSFGIQCICVCLLCKLCTRQCLCVHVLCMCKQVLSMCVCTCVCLCQCVCVHILSYVFIIKTILCVTNKSHFIHCEMDNYLDYFPLLATLLITSCVFISLFY